MNILLCFYMMYLDIDGVLFSCLIPLSGHKAAEILTEKRTEKIIFPAVNIQNAKVLPHLFPWLVRGRVITLCTKLKKKRKEISHTLPTCRKFIATFALRQLSSKSHMFDKFQGPKQCNKLSASRQHVQDIVLSSYQ